MTTLAADASDPGTAAAAMPVSDAAPSDRDARLRELVSLHYDFVWRSLRRLGVSPSDAEDAAQEVFVSLSHRLDDLQPGRERSFLYRIAFNHALHAHRSRLRRREVSDQGLDERPALTPSPEELVEGARAKTLFYRVLEQLELDLRAVFVLYELERMTRAEIAEALEIPAGTVASRLKRARAHFLEQARLAVGDVDAGGE